MKTNRNGWCHHLDQRRLRRRWLDHEHRCYCGMEGTQQQPRPSGGVDVEMLTYSRATQSRSVIGKKKTCSIRWIIPYTPPCATVTRDRLPDAKVGGQTATPGGPTTSRSRVAAQSCAPHTAAMVEAIIVGVCQLVRATIVW
jgi:hypothetical protein